MLRVGILFAIYSQLQVYYNRKKSDGDWFFVLEKKAMIKTIKLLVVLVVLLSMVAGLFGVIFHFAGNFLGIDILAIWNLRPKEGLI